MSTTEELLDERVLLLHYICEIEKDFKLIRMFMSWRKRLSPEKVNEIIHGHQGPFRKVYVEDKPQ